MKATRKSIIKFFKVFHDHQKERSLLTSFLSSFPEHEVFYLATSFKEEPDSLGVKKAGCSTRDREPRVTTWQAAVVSVPARVIIPQYLDKKRTIGAVVFHPIVQ